LERGLKRQCELYLEAEGAHGSNLGEKLDGVRDEIQRQTEVLERQQAGQGPVFVGATE